MKFDRQVRFGSLDLPGQIDSSPFYERKSAGIASALSSFDLDVFADSSNILIVRHRGLSMLVLTFLSRPMFHLGPELTL